MPNLRSDRLKSDREVATTERLLAAANPTLDPGKCPGCGLHFKGERGLRAHQTAKYVTLACRKQA